MTEEATVLTDAADGVLVITINRPAAKNAVNRSVSEGIAAALDKLDADDALRVGVLTGAGGTFCAGMDLKAGADGDHGSTEEFMNLMGEVPNVHWQALLRDNRPSKPLILAVEGYALAGGTEILAGTDIRVAAENATFGVTEVAWGLYPMAGSSIRLPRQIPYCLAAEIVLLGRHVTAREALDWGLVNRLVPAGETLAEAKKIADQIAETGPLALKAITRSLREIQTDVEESQAMLQSDELANPVFASADAKEGMRAFKEKRKANFTGN